MARNRVKSGKGDESSKSSKGKVNLTKRKTERKTNTGKCKNTISYKDLLETHRGYVNQEEAEAFRMLFHGESKAPLDKGHFNSVLHVAKKVIRMSTETFNSGSILGTVCCILGALSPHCDSDDTLKQVETIVSFIQQRFTSKKIEKAFQQVPFDLRYKTLTLFKRPIEQPQQVCATENVEMAFKFTHDEMNAPSPNKAKPGLYVTLVLHLRHFVSFRMRQTLQMFQVSEDEAVKQLIALRFQAFKAQCDIDEIEALGEVIRVLFNMDPLSDNLYLTFDCLIWLKNLTSRSEKRKELTRALVRDFWKCRGTLWVVKWIAEHAEAADIPVGVQLLVNFLETIDLSSEWITELLKKNELVAKLEKWIARRFSDLAIGAKEDLVNQIVNYLQKENLSTETNMNMLISDLLVSLLWMTYYDHRTLFNFLFESLDGLAGNFHRSTCYKTVDVLYSWFKSGSISPLLVEHVKRQTFWFCERSPLLFFEFCLAVTEPHFHDSICNEFQRYVESYIFHAERALFVQYILSPPPIAFNDFLNRRTQEERLALIESMRRTLIPRLCTLIIRMPAGTFLSFEVRCSVTSKLIMNLNDPKMLRNLVKKVTIRIGCFMARFTVDKTYPWVLRMLRENIAMDTFLYSVQMSEEETEYFSDLFIDFFPPKDFVQHVKSPVWRSLVSMLIETKIPSVLSKVKNRLTHLKPPSTMKSSEEIEFWQTVLQMD